jgi:Zn-dependent peptidase ImmA (M78 family)
MLYALVDWLPDRTFKFTYARPAMNTQRIEKAVAQLHKQIWYERKELWPNGTPHPIDMLQPAAAAKVLGLTLEYHEQLGELRRGSLKVELAGVLDRQARRIAVSQRFSIPEMRFTAMHEIGHFILHRQLVIHRDRPIGRMGANQFCRALQELEADYFAACSLMPIKLLKRQFESTFGIIAPLEFDENTVFLLGNGSYDLLLRTREALRARARLVASARHYGIRHFISIAEQFQVSEEAMAIRLEELDLVR